MPVISKEAHFSKYRHAITQRKTVVSQNMSISLDIVHGLIRLEHPTTPLRELQIS